MEYAVYWLVLSLIAGVIASKKGRSGVGFFLLSVFLSPLIGIICAFIATPNQRRVDYRKVRTGTGKKCPHCAEIIKPDAKVCHFCKRELLE